MNQQYKVAVITWNNAWLAPTADMMTRIALRDEDRSSWVFGIEKRLSDDLLADPRLQATIRPLIAIDPEDPEQVSRLADAFCAERWDHSPNRDECDPLTRSSMRDALRSLLPTPSPAERLAQGFIEGTTDKDFADLTNAQRQSLVAWCEAWIGADA